MLVECISNHSNNKIVIESVCANCVYESALHKPMLDNSKDVRFISFVYLNGNATDQRNAVNAFIRVIPLIAGHWRKFKVQGLNYF